MSSGIAPSPCAPSSSTGTSGPAAAASAGASTISPETQPTCEQATSRVAVETSSCSRASGAVRTVTPRFRRAAPTGPSKPGCSCSAMRTSSPSRRPRPTDDAPDALARGGRHRDVLGRRAQEAGVGVAQERLALVVALVVPGRATVLGGAASATSAPGAQRGRRDRGRRSRRSGTRSARTPGTASAGCEGRPPRAAQVSPRRPREPRCLPAADGPLAGAGLSRTARRRGGPARPRAPRRGRRCRPWPPTSRG